MGRIKKTIVTIFAAAFLLIFSAGPFLDAEESRLTWRGGSKYIKNYSRKDYDNQAQNWSVLQDRRGIIYVANDGGLMEFDGHRWREYSIPNISARALALDQNGRVYAGGINEIGFLEADANGSLNYKSLLHHIDKRFRNFSYVWRAFSANEGVYFWTSKYLFRWSSEQFKVWKSKSLFHAAFLCNGKLYVWQKGIGVHILKDDQLHLLPGSRRFQNENIYTLVPYDSKRLLLGTRRNGLFIYDGKSCLPFVTEIDDYLKEHQLFYGLRLSGGEIALATRSGGLVTIDTGGKLKGMFNKRSGLQDNNVKYIMEDSQGNLWAALGKGVDKIEYASPISIYNEKVSGLPGNVLCLQKHGIHKTLYAGTTRGLFRFSPALPSSGSNGKFSPVPGFSGKCTFLLSVRDTLLAATDTGLFEVESSKRIIPDPSYYILASSRNSNRFWVGTNKGLISIYRDNGTGIWNIRRFKHITGEIRTIAEDNIGNFWLGMGRKDVLKLEFSKTNEPLEEPGETIVTRYDSSQGAPGKEVQIFHAAGHVMFATTKGIYRYHEPTRKFLSDMTFGPEFAGGEKGKNVFRIAQEKEGNIWIHSKARNIRAIRQTDGSYLIEKIPFLRIPKSQVNFIYTQMENNTVWFAGVDGLVRFDCSVKMNYRTDFSTLIREVWRKDQLIFNGYGSDKNSNKNAPIETVLPEIKYKDRNLRFQLAAPFFQGEEGTRYRYLLEGYNKTWSDWSKETRKDYTNLDAGVRTFRAQAKNIYQHTGSEALFHFRVLPPWYQTWWAYLIYTFSLLFLVTLLVKWRSRKLVKEKEKLEQIVQLRTHEIQDKNRQLLDQSKKLEEMDQIKSRFFANISHEFRTPLTLIMGPLEQMISACPGEVKEKKRKFTMMQRNSQRLLRLINQLLDLSRLDSGRLNLQTRKTDVTAFIKGVAASFELLAGQNNLELVFHAPEEPLYINIDHRKMEDVMCNILINAVKFTSSGKITITLNKRPTAVVPFPNGMVEISVSDTGCGIPAGQLHFIFDRFYQVKGSGDTHQKGSGIGLALAKEMVELHKGTIEAVSPGEKGTTLIIRLPINHGAAPVNQNHDTIALEPAISETLTRKEPEAIPWQWQDEARPGADDKEIILVVEDSTDVRAYIKDSLEPLYKVVEARDGAEGIERAKEIIPDLIVCDVMMPGTDGYELCRVLKNDLSTSHIPIILLTAKASEESVVEGLETGADDYITKPFSTKILNARIKNLIDLRRHLQQTFNREMTRKPINIAVSGIDQEFVKDLKQVIEKNLSDTDFNVEQLCKDLYMSQSTLYRKIRALSGETPTEFIRSYRLKWASQLLERNFGSVTEVAFEVGFSSRTYFTKCFKEKFHQLPSEYLHQTGGTEKKS